MTTMPESSKTYLAWLREIPGTSSPDSFLKIIEKLEYIRDLQLQVDTKGIHPNRLRQLSKIGSRYEPHSFRRFNDPKKYAILVAYLLELIQDLTDLAFEIHDRQIMILLSKKKGSRGTSKNKTVSQSTKRLFILPILEPLLLRPGAKALIRLSHLMPSCRGIRSSHPWRKLSDWRGP